MAVKSRDPFYLVERQEEALLLALKRMGLSYSLSAEVEKVKDRQGRLITLSSDITVSNTAIWVLPIRSIDSWWFSLPRFQMRKLILVASEQRQNDYRAKALAKMSRGSDTAIAWNAFGCIHCILSNTI